MFTFDGTERYPKGILMHELEVLKPIEKQDDVKGLYCTTFLKLKDLEALTYVLYFITGILDY